MKLRYLGIFSLSVVAACAALSAGQAMAGTYGTKPVNISVGVNGAPPNGPSGQPSVSGDDRTVRHVAFSSAATNLVPNDENSAIDIFVWRRPSGRFPTTSGRGTLIIASVGKGGVRANAGSSAPSMDGSLVNRSRCVAFQSLATNLSPKDALPDSDIYVRDLKKGRTYLASAGLPNDATHPGIAGNCKKVVFASGGRVWWSRVGSGKPHSLGKGSQPSYSRDGKSIVFVRPDGRVVYRRGGAKAVLSRGSEPRVSDRSPGYGWAVVYNSNGNVKIAVINGGRKSVRTVVRRAISGGVSSFAAHRGILVWARRGALYYLNRNSGNSDDLAYASSTLSEISMSARANVVAFTASGGRGFAGRPNDGTPSIYAKWLPK